MPEPHHVQRRRRLRIPPPPLVGRSETDRLIPAGYRQPSWTRPGAALPVTAEEPAHGRAAFPHA